jgi:hypothetical protein
LVLKALSAHLSHSIPLFKESLNNYSIGLKSAFGALVPYHPGLLRGLNHYRIGFKSAFSALVPFQPALLRGLNHYRIGFQSAFSALPISTRFVKRPELLSHWFKKRLWRKCQL